MNKKGDIIIVEDDPDDWEILLEVFEHVLDGEGYENRVVIFEEAPMVIDYLKECEIEPYIIFSDINMPFMDGFELREQIAAHAELKNMFVPFIFLSTADHEYYKVKTAALGAQGHYVKPSSLEVYKKLISDILKEWCDNPTEAH
jgi:CheY-like chemotaxis protein